MLHLAAETDAKIVGLDSVNDNYDVRLKEYRLQEIEKIAQGKSWTFVTGKLVDKALIDKLFEETISIS